MEHSTRRHLAFLSFGIVTLLAMGQVACSGTTLRDVWRDPQYKGGSLKKIAVLVVDRDENRRRFAEDTIVQNLPAGTQATPGYLLLGPLDANPDKAKIRDRLVSDGFDGALVARLAGIIEKQTTQPSQSHTVPQAPLSSQLGFYDPGDPRLPTAAFPDYLGYAAGEATSPGNTRESTDVVAEMQLFVLPAGKPIWRGVTDSMNPESRQALVERITEVVGSRLRSEGLLGHP
jgi:hypothetical protein